MEIVPSRLVPPLNIFETQDFGGTCSVTDGSQASIRHPRRGELLVLCEWCVLKAAQTCAGIVAHAAELCPTPHNNVTSPNNVLGPLSSVGPCDRLPTSRNVPCILDVPVCRTEQTSRQHPEPATSRSALSLCPSLSWWAW